MRTPEKRDVVEPVTVTQHVARDNLALSLGDYPMLYTYTRVGIRIWPTRDIARGKNSPDARFEKLVDGDPVIEHQAGLLGELEVRTNADAGDDYVGVDTAPIVQLHTSVANRAHAVAEVERDALVFVNLLDQLAELLAEHSLEGERLGRDNVDFEPPRDQRSRDLESNEAGANDYCFLAR